MDTLRKDLPSSYKLSPVARQVLRDGKRIKGMNYTAIVESAIREWGLTHLSPRDIAQYNAAYAEERVCATPED